MKYFITLKEIPFISLNAGTDISILNLLRNDTINSIKIKNLIVMSYISHSYHFIKTLKQQYSH